MHQDLITPLFFPTRLQKFPCYGQKFLSEHPEIWFNGITSYLGNGGINSDEFSIILDSPADHSDYPLKDDTHLFFISQRNEHLQHIYGWHFYKIFGFKTTPIRTFPAQFLLHIKLFSTTKPLNRSKFTGKGFLTSINNLRFCLALYRCRIIQNESAKSSFRESKELCPIGNESEWKDCISH